MNGTSRAYLDERNGKLVIDNARIFYKNFSGRITDYNTNGDREFSVAIEDPDLADRLSDDGWNVRISKPKDPDQEPDHYITVTVSYKYDEPDIRVSTGVVGKKESEQHEDTVGRLDKALIKEVRRLVINPYRWHKAGRTGLRGYLHSMYVVLEEDYFADLYAEEEYPEDDLPF